MESTSHNSRKFVNATLIYLLKGNPPEEILLGLKKEGFGKGKYVGYGGKIEPGESIRQAAVRELAEESGIQLKMSSITYVADISFLFPNKPEWNHRVHVFIASIDDTKAKETREMDPCWFKLGLIPYEKMWDDSYYWLPKILSGEKIKARFIFNSDNRTVGTAEFTPLCIP